MLVLLMLGVISLTPGELVMKSGKLLAYKGEYIIEGPWIKFTSSSDDELCLPLKMVDLEKTRERDKKLASESQAKQSETVQESSFAELVRKSSPKSAGTDGGKIPSFTGLKKAETDPALDYAAYTQKLKTGYTAKKITFVSLMNGTLADWARASGELRAKVAITMTQNVASIRKRDYSGRQGGFLLGVDANALMQCINEVAVDERLGHARVDEVAAACVLLLD